MATPRTGDEIMNELRGLAASPAHGPGELDQKTRMATVELLIDIRDGIQGVKDHLEETERFWRAYHERNAEDAEAAQLSSTGSETGDSSQRRSDQG